MSNPQTKEKDPKEKKVRVFNLAKELNLESKVLLDYCKELGFAGVNNQLSGLAPEQADALKERVKKGPRPGTTSPSTPAPSKPVIPTAAQLTTATKVQTLPKPKPALRPAPVEFEPVAVEPQIDTPPPEPETPENLPEAPAVVAETRPPEPAAPPRPHRP